MQKVNVLLGCAVVVIIILLYTHFQQDQLIAELSSSRSSKSYSLGGATTTTKSEASTDLISSSDWKPVYVYRGGPPPNVTKRWTGQVEQDKLISWLLKNKTNGYFVDLAANGFMKLSNTFSLERNLNWNGLCIEANSDYWHDLGHFRSCTVLGAVIGGQADDKVMFAMKGAFGGITGESFDNKNLPKAGVGYERYTAQLEKTFETFNVPKLIDYFSLDVEGAEDFIMDAFPLERYRFRFLTVERPSAKLTQRLADHGYSLIKKLVYFGDTLFAHESEMPLDMSIIDKYCTDSRGRYCTDKKPV